MKHYKDQAGNLYAYESDGSQDADIKPGLVAVTDAEVAAIRAAQQPTAAQLRAAEIRARLAVIDAESIRALRVSSIARTKGQPVPATDATKLDTLETEAAALRAELAGLPA